MSPDPAHGPRRRRLAHVFATFGRGGPQVRAVQLMQHLGDGFEHVVMAMDGDLSARALLDPATAARVRFVEPPARGGFRTTRRAQRVWLDELGPALVLTYNWGAIETVAAARRARLPLVHHEDGFGPEEVRRRFVRRNLFRRWLLRGVPVVVPSAVLAAIARREWGIGERFVHHLVNGVDLSRFAPGGHGGAGRQDGQDGAPFVFGTVGGLRPEKDHGNLLRALARLPGDVAVELVGSGRLEAQLRSDVAALGLGDRVTFAGHTDDTAASYRRFDAFVLSSRTEQMPIAMLEAMATGLPVVATDVGDVRRILPPEAEPVIVPPENDAALAGAMQRLHADPELRRRLGHANRRTVERQYEAGACLERFAALYRERATTP